MGKQAIGCIGLNQLSRLETLLYLMVYPQVRVQWGEGGEEERKGGHGELRYTTLCTLCVLLCVLLYASCTRVSDLS